jgi:hypothetical protein
MPEREIVLGYGGRVEYVSLVPGISTSNVVSQLGH